MGSSPGYGARIVTKIRIDLNRLAKVFNEMFNSSSILEAFFGTWMIKSRKSKRK